MMTRIALIVVASLLFTATVHAQDVESRIEVDARSFVFARYATRTPSCLYTAFGMGPGGAFFGMVEAVSSGGYQEVIGGLFSRVASGPADLVVGVAFADASDSNYIQTYLLPSAAFGRVSLSATTQWYEPIQSTGIRQIDVNPLTGLFRLAPHVSAGGVYAMGYTDGQSLRHRAGPALQLDALTGALKLEVLRNITRAADEVRFVFAASF
jgi:hypothetical protein